ncbi:winged helix-turn-helix domain-containing protein [Legionella dresdenensis]|uniref:Winged helix-turn-helix domain-containing protein n=1 Tax=Legionella dresdenensis TaxID=450200 RepID=A0ABV8CF85_9GAMM
MPSHQKYLFIVDDAPVAHSLLDYFSKFNLGIIQFETLSQLQEEQRMPAAVLIHCSFIENNITLLNDFYHCYQVPLIILGNDYDEKQCVDALEAGADDFVVKPLHPRELHARISAISRRVQRFMEESAEYSRDVLSFANWKLYPSSRQVFDLNNNELPLSTGEYDLLLAFVKQPHRILGREFLLQITKSSELNPFDRRIDVQVSRLRQKIEMNAGHPELIKTIRNGGYMLTCDVTSGKEENKG